MILKTLFTNIADKLKIKLNSTEKIKAFDFPEAIENIITLTEGTARTLQRPPQIL